MSMLSESLAGPAHLQAAMLIPLLCVVGAILLAEGCVKRPNWEPTTGGVSPKEMELRGLPDDPHSALRNNWSIYYRG
jgi:hypothetical protein